MAFGCWLSCFYFILFYCFSIFDFPSLFIFFLRGSRDFKKRGKMSWRKAELVISGYHKRCFTLPLRSYSCSSYSFLSMPQFRAFIAPPRDFGLFVNLILMDDPTMAG